MKPPRHLGKECLGKLLHLAILLPFLISGDSEAQFLFYEEGYRYNPENHSVYRLTPESDSWTNSQKYAREHRIGGVKIPGDLVTIRSSRENDWLVDEKNDLTTESESENLWIGFTEAEMFSPEPGVWSWISGEPGTYLSGEDDCTRFCNFASGINVKEPAPDFAFIQDFRGNNAGAWFPDTDTSNSPEGPWQGIVEFVEPFAGAHADADNNEIPDSWEDQDQNGTPDGYENGGPLPAPRNLRAAFAVGDETDEYSVRLVWDPADSPDLLGYNIYHAPDPSFTQRDRLNRRGLAYDPQFRGGVRVGAKIADGSVRFFRVEALLRTDGVTRRTLSNIATATVGEYIFSLPDSRAKPAMDERNRYPISLANARGVMSTGLGFTVEYPDFLTNVSVERTPLTRRFPNVTFSDRPEENRISIRFPSSTAGESPLNGEGALVNLVFDVAATTPVGTKGEVKVTQAFVSTTSSGPNGAPVDLSDIGSITVHPRFVPGDIDGSADITIADVSAAALLAFGAVPHRGFLGGVFVGSADVDGDGVRVAAGDITGDGVSDISDVNRIIAILKAKKRNQTLSTVGIEETKGAGDFRIELADTPFEKLPGSAEMGVELTMPPTEGDGISGAAFTVAYATDHVDLTGVELDGKDFQFLFYDQRDYSRGWKPGRVKVIVSSDQNKVINGSVAKVKFDSIGTPTVSSSDVPFVSGKMAKSSGEDIAWNNFVGLEEGTLIFGATPELDINVVVDDVINAEDLLIFIDRVKQGTAEGEILNEFSKEWLTPRVLPEP